MTPFWRRFVKEALSHRDKSVRARGEAVLGAQCFDLAGVDVLIRETIAEMMRDIPTNHPFVDELVDLGDRTIVPSPHVWLERRDRACRLLSIDGWRFEVMLYAQYQSLDGPTLELGTKADQQGTTMGWITDLGDGIFKVEPTHSPFADDGIHSLHLSSMYLYRALASIAVLNSPSALREPVEPHRGLERAIRRQLGNRRIDSTPRATTIVLGAPRGQRIGTAHEEYTPRAYHFCRAHIRQRASGRLERVRAHWRGDAAYGIRIGSYRMSHSMTQPIAA